MINAKKKIKENKKIQKGKWWLFKLGGQGRPKEVISEMRPKWNERMDMIWKKNVPRRGKGLSGNKFGMSEGQ